MDIRKQITTVKLLLMVALVSWSGAAARAQQLNLPPECGEKVMLFADRSMYTVAEEIHFTASIHLSLNIPVETWSNLVYAELISWDGTRFGQTKLSTEDGTATGAIRIPPDLKSGHYYLRAYTRWMRNYSPYAYAYLPVRIVNPNIPDVYPGPEEIPEGEQSRLLRYNHQEGSYAISGLKPSYGPREMVELNVSNLPVGLKDMVIDVIPADMQVSAGGSFSRGEMEPLRQGPVKFFPESDGLTLSAVLANKEDGKPVAGMKVALSAFTFPFYFGNAISDESGRVQFSLPKYTGSYEFFMVPEGEGRSDTDVLINNDFCEQAVTLPYTPFELLEEEIQMVSRMIKNAQIMSRFRTNDSEGPDQRVTDHPFYGSPYAVIYEDDFIELIDLKEFFFELVPNVSVMSPNKNPRLFVHSETSLLPYPPLVLIDNIPVANDAQMLSIPCSRIERIEVINSGYVIGPFKYSGVVSIYSLDKDIAGYKLPENSHFFNYSLLSQGGFSAPVYAEDNTMGRQPDLRNTLAWEVMEDMPEDGTVPVSFYTGDASGKYRVILRGVDDQQQVYTAEAFFEVK